MLTNIMPDYESLLKRWQSAGALDAETAARIRAFETASARAANLQQETLAEIPSIEIANESSRRPVDVAGGTWQGRVALILGGILLGSGVVLFVSAPWDQLGPEMRFLLVIAMVTVFHLGGAIARAKYKATSTLLHAVGTLSTGAAIALVGQIFNIQEHWPAAVLMWAVAAL